MNINRDKWDESVPLHVASPLYDVPSFLKGRTTLEPLEIDGVGSVRGRRLLHLQCHFGLDTLSWARLGADVTGVDFSLPAIRAARALARQAGIDARFVHSNLYDLPKTLRGTFDIVYTGKGATCWLPDIDRWAEIVAQYLSPGGRFFLLEDHPVIEVYPNGDRVEALEAKVPYFTPGTIREEYDGTYATSVKMKHRVSYSWIHRVGQVLSALANAGLEIEAVREYPFTYWKRYRFMVEDSRGYWKLTRGHGMLPLSWSVTARRKVDAPPRKPARSSR